MNLSQWMCAPLIASILCAPVAGSCGVIRGRRVVTHNAAVVVKDVAVVDTIAVAVFQPVVVSVPAYGASYVPSAIAPTPVAPAAPAPAPATEAPSRDKAILEALRRLERRLERLEKGGAAPKVMPKADDESREETSGKEDAAGGALAVFQNKCSQCHDQKSAESKGGGFAFLKDGKLLDITDKQAVRISVRTYNSTMPPKKSGLSLSDEDVAAIQEWLAARK